jgi:hypothetical protein
MKNHTYIYTFSVLLVFFLSQSIFSQTTDSIPVIKERYGLRLGTDAFKLVRSFYDENYQGLEFMGDFRISKNKYLAAEIGNEKLTTNDDRLNFTTSGSFIKAGIDFNLYENWLDMENMVFMGFRYGFSTFSQKLNSYKIYNTDNYFGENPDVVSNQEFNGLTSQWLEIMLGLKAEVLSNVYMGFNVRLHYLVNQSTPDNFNNLYITGFGKISEGNKFGAGFSYTISYFIPLYKKEKNPVKE